MHLYQQVETQIMEMIDNGLLNPGDKLPSLRRLSIRMNLSLSTINQAYLELEKKGLISARARSGFYVRQGLKRLPKLKAPRPSKAQAQPVGRAQIIDQVLASINQPEMLPLGLAYPEENLLPVKQLSRIAIGVLKEQAGKALGYGSVQGNAELRRQIAFRSVDWGPVLDPGQIITTFGALDAIGIALRSLTRPGDNVLIASPCYYGFLMLLASLGLKAVEVPNHPEHGLPMDQVEQTLKRLPIKAVLISSNFNNPDGAIIPGESKKELVRLLARQDIPLIEDDIYGEIFTGSARPRSCKAHDKKDLVISCGSFSKTLAPGYRVGWIAAGAHTSRMLRTKSALNPYCASFNQMVLAEFLRQGLYDRHLSRLRREIRRQMAAMQLKISQYFPSGVRCSRPKGGMTLWLKLPGRMDAGKYFQAAAQQGIGLAPGVIFSNSDKYKSFFRLGCGNQWSEDIDQGLMALGKLAKQMGGE